MTMPGDDAGKKKSGSPAKPPLHLRRNENIAKGLVRLAILQLSAASKLLQARGISAEAVHDARTFGKKTRALLQLCSPCLPKSEKERLSDSISSASRRLSGIRDADVLLETLDGILSLHPEPDAPGLHSLRRGMADVARQRRANDGKLLPGTLALLHRALKSLASAEFGPMDGKQLLRRVQRTYRRGRLMLDACSGGNDPEMFHSWRKLVKQLWYQLRITSRRWPSHAEGLIRISGEIGELAGRERDLSLLEVFLETGIRSREALGIRRIIRKERERLRKKALDLGSTLYARRPRDFIGEMS